MRIALLTGGSTGEREVALASAAYVEKMIGDRMEIEVFDIPKDLDRFVKNRGDFDCVLPVLHGKGGENGELQRHLDVVEVPYVFKERKEGGSKAGIKQYFISLVHFMRLSREIRRKCKT